MFKGCSYHPTAEQNRALDARLSEARATRAVKKAMRIAAEAGRRSELELMAKLERDRRRGRWVDNPHPGYLTK